MEDDRVLDAQSSVDGAGGLVLVPGQGVGAIALGGQVLGLYGLQWQVTDVWRIARHGGTRVGVDRHAAVCVLEGVTWEGGGDLVEGRLVGGVLVVGDGLVVVAAHVHVRGVGRVKLEVVDRLADAVGELLGGAAYGRTDSVHANEGDGGADCGLQVVVAQVRREGLTGLHIVGHLLYCAHRRLDSQRLDGDVFRGATRGGAQEV